MRRSLAVFDVDGTLLAGDSHVQLLRALVIDRSVSFAVRAEIVGGALGWALGLVGDTWTKEIAARAFAGRRVEDVRAYCRRFGERSVLGLLRPAVLGHARAERERGRLIVLLSASLEPVVETMRAVVRADRVVAAKLAVAGGVVTGRLDGEVPYGPAKARALVRLAADIDADLARSSGYGDHHADIGFLRLVGEPHAVAPDARLYAAARRAGWPIVEC